MRATSQMGTPPPIAWAMRPAAGSSLPGLLATLHAGAVDAARWKVFVGELRLAVGADHANLVFRRRDAPMNQMTPVTDGRLPSEELLRRYLDSLYRIDPLPYHRLTPGRVYSLPELIDENTPDTGVFIKEFLEPAGVRHLRIVRVVEPGGFQAWLTVSRADIDFAAPIDAFMAMVAGHVAIALQAFSAIEEARQHGALSEAATGRLAVGFVTLDADGVVVDSDAHARRLLADSALLSLGDARHLIVTPPAAKRALRAALKNVATGAPTRARAIHLGDAPRLDMMLVPYGAPAVSGQRTPVLTAYLHGSPTEAPEAAEQLREMFALTPTEARLALAIVQGQTIRQASADIGITIETARTYSKRIFQKTGTHRQPELVRLILSDLAFR